MKMCVFFSTWFHTRSELLQEEIHLFGTLAALRHQTDPSFWVGYFHTFAN